MAALSRAPWIDAQARKLLAQRGHAWLLAGPSGLGQFELAMTLVRAWLCEQSTAQRACGQCASCHAIDVHTHSDLCVLMPETAMLALGWPLSEKARDEIEAKKRKPSREIRVEAMRDAVEFAQRTSARGRGKAVLVFPAERMNVYTANALLKTLEEPAGDVRFVLATEAAHALLPTIRSRCLWHTMAWPDAQESMQWLLGQGVPEHDAQVMLRAAGGRAQEALSYAPLVALWAKLPTAVARGDVGFFKDWSAGQLIDALQKLAHDLMLRHAGAAPRFFLPADLPAGANGPALSRWFKDLARSRRHEEHPFNLGLMHEALLSQAQIVLNSRP
jgi:DNA polymerase-3 subunit delta'